MFIFLSVCLLVERLVFHNRLSETSSILSFSHNKAQFLYFSTVRLKIGPFATPDVIQSAPALPKTRSGKIMRRVLRQIAKNEKNFGDLTTIYDPSIVDELLANRPHVDFLIN